MEKLGNLMGLERATLVSLRLIMHYSSGGDNNWWAGLVVGCCFWHLFFNKEQHQPHCSNEAALFSSVARVL